MKSSACESIRNAFFNLERLSRSFRLVWPGISALERLWNGTFHVQNLMHKLLLTAYFTSRLREMRIFLRLNYFRLELRSASELVPLAFHCILNIFRCKQVVRYRNVLRNFVWRITWELFFSTLEFHSGARSQLRTAEIVRFEKQKNPVNSNGKRKKV